MKSIKLFFILFTMCTFMACDDTDSNDENAAMLNGTWTMQRVSGSISGAEHDFPDGMINWTFNHNAKTLTVVNGNMDTTLQDGLESGTYSYTFKDSDAPETCARTLVIDGEDFGCYIFTETGLRISQSYADGMIYDFVAD